jgi:nucleotide-binding universal stress UspA family protein
MKEILVGVDGSPELQDFSEWERVEREYARTVLRELSDRCIEAGVQADEVMPSGRPAETLAQMAAARAISMVVVGHRGRNAVARALIGSVADELAQTSPKPVLIVR